MKFDGFITKVDEKWIKRANKKIKKTNEAFKKASVEKKRVMIAQDIIGLISLGHIQATNGTYVEASTKEGIELDVGAKMQMQQIFGNFTKLDSCSVCAIGSAMVSTMRLANNITVGQFDGSVDEGGVASRDWNHGPWLAIFGHRMLRSMECTFEHEDCNLISEIKDSELRLFAIWSHVIENNGVWDANKIPTGPVCRHDVDETEDNNEKTTEWIKEITSFEKKLEKCLLKLRKKAVDAR